MEIKNSTQTRRRAKHRPDPTEFPLGLDRACPFDGLFWRVEEILAAFDEGREFTQLRIAA
jgi:hypothetical protein